jgi:hypothetical protein
MLDQIQLSSLTPAEEGSIGEFFNNTELSPTLELPKNERLEAPRIIFIEIPKSNQTLEEDLDSAQYDKVVTIPDAQDITSNIFW